MPKKKINPIIVILVIIVFIFIARQRGFLGAVGNPSAGSEFITGYADLTSAAYTTYGPIMHAQTFEVSQNAQVTDLAIKIVKSSGNPGRIYVGIRNFDGEKPTGLDLTSGYLEDSVVAPTTTDIYYLSVTSYELESGKKYALVVQAPNGDNSNNYMIYSVADNGDRYDLGKKYYTTDGGTTWKLNTGGSEGQDLYFEIWGIITGCIEDWTCNDWSTCTGGVQTRTCTDNNNCGTTNNKPPESQSCAVDCATLRTELGVSISQWIADSITRDTLGVKISEWASC